MAQTPCKRARSAGSVKYTPVAAVIAGQVVVVGSIPMIAPGPIEAGAEGDLEFIDQWDCPKASGAWTQGDAIYWDADGDPVDGTAGSGCMTTTATGNTLAGFAAADAAADAAFGKVEMTAAKRTNTIAGSVTADDLTGSDASLAIAGLSAAQGGAVAITGGPSSGSNAGGAVSMTGGTGGAGQAGGAASVVGGVPASGNAAGGAVNVTGGAGSGTGAGGATAVAGGASGTGATGNGGAASVTGGAALSTNGSGGAVSMIGGVATGTGTGGALTLRSGASAGASGTAGAVILDAGAATGGTGAPVQIGPTNATGVQVGNGGSERALIKSINVSGTIAVAVPSITDPDIAKVDVDVSAMTFAPAVGDAVIAIPLEALPTNARLQGAQVSDTDTVQVTFGSEGGNVTGANKNFKFLFIDLT